MEKMKFILIFVTVAMAVAADADDADTFIQASSIKMASKSLITCPDQSSTCPFGTTCCKLFSGGYGCCRYPEATCCSDKKHCCPNGYQCDDQSERCVKAVGNDTLPWAKKERASSLAFEAPVNMVCPDGGSCAPMAACCRSYAGSFTCCNFPNNVCCDGGQQCCPRGSVCDVRARKCLPGLVASPWLALTGTRATQSQPAP